MHEWGIYCRQTKKSKWCDNLCTTQIIMHTIREVTAVILLFIGLHSDEIITNSQSYSGNIGQSVYSCRNDSRWQLTTAYKPSSKALDIFEISNVIVSPGSLYNTIKITVDGTNESSTAKIISDRLHRQVTSCSGTYNSQENRNVAVFFNCPCVMDTLPDSIYLSNKDKYCPTHIEWLVDSKSVLTLTSSMIQKDLLVVFNSWGDSLYHGLIDTVFPLWCTIRTMENMVTQLIS